MRFMIVGVGQTFNFETKQMDDVLQVQAPDGSTFSVPTTNEAAQALIRMAMNGHGEVQHAMPPAPREDDPMGQQLAQAFRQAGDRPVAVERELSGRVEERFQPPEGSEDFPDGADIFGGEVSEAPEEEPMGLADGSMAEPQVQQRIFQKTQQTAKSKMGLRRNPADRSGVPSFGIARVDEKGNPILPAAPDTTMIDDEEDPGEQV